MRKPAARIARPAAAPWVTVEPLQGRRIAVCLRDNEMIGRARPRGVAGAAVFIAVAQDKPAIFDMGDWRFVTTTARTRLTIELLPHFAAHPGSMVWITAQWLSPRLEAGPAYTYTLGGPSSFTPTLQAA